MAPPLYARFKNGFVYGYLEGKPFSVQDMSDLHKSKLVARKLGIWHKMNWVEHPTAKLFTTLWKWFNGVPSDYSKPETNGKFKNHVNMSYIKNELILLEKKLMEIDSPIVFCHNDLLSANIIYKQSVVDKNGSFINADDAEFIDYEYGCHNYRGFDIANHFCEFAGFECDYTKYPSKEFQLEWFKEYLSSLGKPFELEGLEILYEEVSMFSLAAHFFWGLWGLIQAQYSDIDFDYMSYAIMRFAEYEKRKLLQ